MKQPLQDAEEEVFLGSEIIESPSLARVGPGYDGIERGGLDSPLEYFRVACPLEGFATAASEFGISPAWTHQMLYVAPTQRLRGRRDNSKN
jgi:hypothetical protein